MPLVLRGLRKAFSGWRTSSLGRQLGLLVVGIVLGLLMILQWNTHQQMASYQTSYSRDRTTLTIASLEAEQEALKRQIGQLREELGQLQKQKASDTVMLRDINNQLEREKLVAGLLPVQGPGVVVTLNDSGRDLLPPNADPNQYLIHEYDLRDVVNLLWAAGAEAVSVNDERIIATSSIYCAGSTVMVNATRLSPPYVVRAIGPADRMDEYLRNPAYLPELRRRVKLYGLELKVGRPDKVTLQAYQGSVVVRYASTGE